MGNERAFGGFVLHPYSANCLSEKSHSMTPC